VIAEKKVIEMPQLFTHWDQKGKTKNGDMRATDLIKMMGSSSSFSAFFSSVLLGSLNLPS
jgi:hypothetical protein